MNNKNYKNLIHDLKKISLTNEERSALLSKLNHHINKKTVSSPYFSYFHFRKTYTYVFASLLVIVLAGGGTLSASAQALPGDFLYPVKVKVAEPLKVALARTSEVKQKIEVQNIEERLNEAEVLAIQGRLASTTAIAIKKNVEDRIESFRGKLSKENQENLDVKISAHAIVLRDIKNNSDDDQKLHVEDIAKTVDAHKPVKVSKVRVEVHKAKTVTATMTVSEPITASTSTTTPAATIEAAPTVSEIDIDKKVEKEVENIDKKIEKRTSKNLQDFRKERENRGKGNKDN